KESDMKICIDDGSTNIKLAWTENGERRNAISPNSFKSEWSAPFGGTQPANYMLDGVRYGFDPVSDRFVQTTDTQYQYSDVNVIAIHHALVKSGITPQEVDVVVTLPLSDISTQTHSRNANINRKKANVMRPVEYQNGEAFTIRNVRVMPESIPAGFKALADMSPFESLLIVDLAEPRWMWQRFRGNWQDQPGVLRSTRRRFPDSRCRTVGDGH
ncbi:plasmid segregation protein ParM domain-containing protein, partial [Escherichia coli]|uniref:plasmid segregation protein ParM domain-containing protein n=1 Tax=Escherichia coli TaxID=562 RepID=UPI003D811473